MKYSQTCHLATTVSLNIKLHFLLTRFATVYREKDYATVVGEMAPRLVEKAKLQN